jgi:hypothetical protein
MAFQALAPFAFEKDLTLDRWRRHHKQLMKRDPSSYISVSDSFGKFKSMIYTAQY